MRRSASVQLVLLPMLATAAVASAQPGPQDPYPPPAPPQAPVAGDPAPPGMTDPDISPPGLTPVEGYQSGVQEDGVVCDAPETWPVENQQLGVPPYECRAVMPRCDDPSTWDERSRELGYPPEECGRSYGVYTLHGGGFYRERVIRGGFGHYFGTGGG